MTQAKSPTLSYRLCYNLPWVVTPKIELNTKQTVVKTEHFTAVFLYPKVRKEVAEMAKRNRTNPVQFYLSDDEQYILTAKFKASGMKSMSAFLRKVECVIGITDDDKHGCSLIADHIQFHFVIRHDFSKLLNIKW